MLHKYYRELVSYFSRELKDRDAARDVVHEGYARVLAFAEGRALAEPRAMLFRTTQNVVIDQARRRQVEEQVLAAYGAIANDCAQSAEDVAIARQRLQQLLAQLRAMPRLRRSVFVMVRMYGCTHAEAAAHLGLSLAAVEQHMVRAVLDLNRRSRPAD